MRERLSIRSVIKGSSAAGMHFWTASVEAIRRCCSVQVEPRRQHCKIPQLNTEIGITAQVGVAHREDRFDMKQALAA